MRKNNKGFTLIELLAVIVILGLLMAIAIPSVTKYITQSRKKTLVSTMDSYVTAVTSAVNENEFGAMSNQDTMYYIPVSNDATKSCISLEKGGTDPFGNWLEAYVVVNYDAENYSYDYYFTFYDDAGYGMELTKIEDIDANGSMIKNPSLVNADNIKKQKNNRASNEEILIAGICKANSLGEGGASGGDGSPEDPKVTTLAGTTWKFNEHISGYEFLDVFDYQNQTGWDDMPDGCIITGANGTYNFWGLTRTYAFGFYIFGTVQSSSIPFNYTYAPSNNLGIDAGWYANDPWDFLSGEKPQEEVLVNYKKTKTTAPVITFSTESNSALENTQLINWMYENATRIK